MGVRGVKRLLRDVGWLPSLDADDDDENDVNGSRASRDRNRDHAYRCAMSNCTSQLWMDWNASDALLGRAPPLEKIPPRSLFLIDGNGLAFHLYSVAYTRHLWSLAQHEGPASSHGDNGSSRRTCSPLTKSFSSESIVKALPFMLPLSLLRQLTKEFISTLQQHCGDQLEIQVLWDGRVRRFKERTDQERGRNRDQEESNLEHFCRFGSMPKRRYACEWKDDFPYASFFLTCVRHALSHDVSSNVVMIDCVEEADVELAKRASGKTDAYVLGLDSDFFFYRDIQYISLNQLSIQPSGLHAFCARRSELARLLGLDDARMVDLAMLMGNDYIDPVASLTVPHEINLKSVQSIVFFLQCHEDYLATAKDDGELTVVDFVRNLYNNAESGYVLDRSQDDPDDETTTRSPILMAEDRTVHDALIRYLQSTLDQPGNDDSYPLSLEALEAYKSMGAAKGLDKYDQHMLMGNGTQRPRWEDVQAATFIEAAINRLYRSLPDALLIRATPPDALMNRLEFHSILDSLRSRAEHHNDDDGSSNIPRVEDTTQLEASFAAAAPVRLPIDEHETAILENIEKHRCTIIHGETGSGKSSRVPVMLLKAPAPDGSLRKVKFFISQPRRIAAKALVERVRSCEPHFRNKFALRMGHGWKEYESSETQVYFVTAGYLVRLLANHPERFDDCTHLVIDEVHERSVDTDLLCLLSRRLLETNKHIRLVLMSATLATKLYRDYFNVPNEPIHVGVRPFPITEYFIEDLCNFGLPQTEVAAALSIQKEIEAKHCRSPPTSTELTKRLSLAARLTTVVGEPGASVLIFVPGLAEIISISECIEGFHVAGVRYTIYPIHGDIPFEEQMGAFNKPAKDEIKVIIATNAAESSVTLPSVDHVICLGLCRQIMYNQASHRQILLPAWISKASATQRAGRTGRVRPGSVYRLYTRNAFEQYMEEFEPGEMVRIPLDSVILMLKLILHEEVKPVFLDCLEPPALDTIDRSFQSLHRWNFITEPDDQADITSLGAFVSSLGVDLSLGSYIGLGIQFGVAAEAIEMAAMMSVQKTPFQIASPLWLSSGDFNEIASHTYVSKCKFDAGLYSEPMALMNGLWEYEVTANKTNWCFLNRIAIKRWQQVVSSRNSLRKRVADFMGINEEHLRVRLPPKDMPHSKVAILRLLKVWVFSESIIECAPSSLKFSQDGSVSVSIKAKAAACKLNESQLSQVLDSKKHPHTIVESIESEQTGIFQVEGTFVLQLHIEELESRLLSYMSEMNIEAALCSSSNTFFLYLDETQATGKSIWNFLERVGHQGEERRYFAFQHMDVKRRGIQERPCGLWSIHNTPNQKGGLVKNKKIFRRLQMSRNDGTDFVQLFASVTHELHFSELKSLMTWYFFPQGSGKNKKKTTSTQPFSVSQKGACKEISKQNLQDILGRDVTSVSSNMKNIAQSIVFLKSSTGHAEQRAPESKPLFLDVPEGCRVLALLASSQRKVQALFRVPRRTSADSETNEDEVDEYKMKQEEVDVSKRWRRLDTGSLVFVEDSVPATAINTASDLYAVAASSLELQRGGLKVEGLTLLPINPLFLLIALLSFGLEPNTPISWTQNEDHGETKKLKKALVWLLDRTKAAKKKNDANINIVLYREATEEGAINLVEWTRKDVEARLIQAICFHESSLSMGEKLVCFPEKVEELCKLLEDVDGEPMLTWPFLADEALTEENLSVWQCEKKTRFNTEVRVRNAEGGSLMPVNGLTKEEKEEGSRNSETRKPNTRKENGKKNTFAHHAIRNYDEQTKLLSRLWFATDLNHGEQMPKFPSMNILALLFRTFEDQVLDGMMKSSMTINSQSEFLVSLTPSNWEVYGCRQQNDSILYMARFVNTAIPDVPVSGRGKNKLPKWIKRVKRRPSTISDAHECVPPSVEIPKCVELEGGLLFASIHDALQMEAAFWLEQQFCHSGKSSTRHWYLHSIDSMIQVLRKVYEGSSNLGAASSS